MYSGSFSSQPTLDGKLVMRCPTQTRSFRPTSDIANMILFLKEWESVEPDHLIRNPVRAKEVPHGFSYKQNDLRAI